MHHCADFFSDDYIVYMFLYGEYMYTVNIMNLWYFVKLVQINANMYCQILSLNKITRYNSIKGNCLLKIQIVLPLENESC